MRIELDEGKPLTKTKLRQALKLIGKDSNKIKVILGSEIFNIDRIISNNGVLFLCTNAKETSKFYEKRVAPLKDKDDICSDEDTHSEDCWKGYADTLESIDADFDEDIDEDIEKDNPSRKLEDSCIILDCAGKKIKCNINKFNRYR